MALVPYEIPLSPQAQKFAIALGGVTYNLTVKWNNAPQGGWILDIADQNDVPLVGGIPLVTGADLLAQYDYLGFGGKLLVQTDYDAFATPTFTNLGTQCHLYFFVEDNT